MAICQINDFLFVDETPTLNNKWQNFELPFKNIMITDSMRINRKWSIPSHNPLSRKHPKGKLIF